MWSCYKKGDHSMSDDYFMKITEDQQAILNEAIELLKKYDSEKYSGRSA